MQKLAKREEQIMQACWHLEKAFIKDIIAELPEPKPHYNSVATMVRILEEKGFLDHETFGNTFRYYPKTNTRNTPLTTWSGNTLIIPTPACWPISPKNKKFQKKKSTTYWRS